MIIGIGTDIIEVERIAKAIERRGHPFLDRLFTKQEQNYCLQHNISSRNFAGRFAAKEAIAKAFGTGIGGKVGWLDLEIASDEFGKPYLKKCEKLDSYFQNKKLLLSISHCKEYATAVAIWEAI